MSIITTAQSKTKKSAYEKRKQNGIPAPLDDDSDPEFNAGEYIPEPKKRKKSASSRGRKKAKQGPAQEDSDADAQSPRRKRIKIIRPRVDPLRDFFGDEFGVFSGSEEEYEVPAEEEAPDEDEDEDLDPDDRLALQLERQEAASSVKTIPKTTTEDSVTESESEPEKAQAITVSSALKRTSPFSNPAAKRVKFAPNLDDSVTESETDEEVSVEAVSRLSRAFPKAPAKMASSAGDDSMTESESEDETEDHHPRPVFHRPPSQPLMGPLVLDPRQHIKVPASINTFLREYQRDGVRFLYGQYVKRLGALLGDDMGLGKTVQVISFLSAIMKKTGDARDEGRRREHVSQLQDREMWRKHRKLPPANETWPTCLIIAPTSVVPNWEREFETWGYFEVGVYRGDERKEMIRDFKLGRLDVVITSFDLARRDIALLDDLAWSCVIVDEVHRVKNPRSQITQAYNRFNPDAVRIGLTGTAIQNKYEEMHTLLDWTSPGRLGTAAQWQFYVAGPLTRGQSKSCTEEERARADIVAVRLRDKLMPQFFKRRTKDIISDQLPNKTDKVVFCPLTPKQILVYKRILGMPEVRNMVQKDDPCDCKSGRSRKQCCHPWDNRALFQYISTLIKISNHLALIVPAPGDSAEQVERNRALSRVAFGQYVPKYGETIFESDLCGKWLVLEGLLEEWRQDKLNKILIFTKSVKLLELLEYHLRRHNYGFLRLDGSTPHNARMPLIDRFHEDPKITIFLISTMAGGTGLNLTGANKVVIFDPNWNPAHDLQAMDRAYRFGQTRDVAVYRLLGAGSLEELIYARQVYKQQQMRIGYEASVQTRYFDGVQGDPQRQGELFGIKNIFTLHEDTLATKKAIEDAQLSSFDWALAHGESGKKKKEGDVGWVYEAEEKGAKEDGDLKGLGALLFDDAPVKVPAPRDVATDKTLVGAGIRYAHVNDDLLKTNPFEEQRSRIAVKELKRKAKRSKRKSESKSPERQPEWPPRRPHHKPPVDPKTRLENRQLAMIEMGLINHPRELRPFVERFLAQPAEEQQALFAKLDEYAKQHPSG